ncbi:hypothetical protein, partial [Barnesiella sp. An55]|uniref:hypothetical protein n=1 Tax=Barnesiella sp. An55 TaxID=1965646 RepID=UPI0019D2C90B
MGESRKRNKLKIEEQRETPPLSGRERASRRRERGEECLSSQRVPQPPTMAPPHDRLGPITAAALLGSFFSLLRRMNNYVR